MAKIEAGCVLGEYTVDTAFESGVKLSDLLKRADKTVLLFLRYYGCRICQLEMRDYTAIYDAFRAKNAQVIVVLQSAVAGADQARRCALCDYLRSGAEPFQGV